MTRKRMNVKDHYNKHLGNFYSWMCGDFDLRQSEHESFFRSHAIEPSSTKNAFDLGCGHGLQTTSLSNLEFFVKAVDFNDQLLEELTHNINSLSIEIIKSDIIDFLESEEVMVDVVVCMGDTITHLKNINEVDRLIQLSTRRLIDKGKMIFSFRDLTHKLKNEERFILVKQDSERILTCFLEYFSEHVMVHDILYERHEERWLQKVSSYPKIKLGENVMIDLLDKNGLKLISKEIINGMIYIIAEKPSHEPK